MVLAWDLCGDGAGTGDASGVSYACASFGSGLSFCDRKTYIRMNDADRKIWRRLWWMIYVRQLLLSLSPVYCC